LRVLFGESQNVSVTKPVGFRGIYCLDATGPTHNIIATTDGSASIGAQPRVRKPPAGSGCEGYDFEVTMVLGNATSG
jgi:hypothetical protein